MTERQCISSVEWVYQAKGEEVEVRGTKRMLKDKKKVATWY